MRTLILGKKNVGKTTYIKEKIVPELKYCCIVVIDLLNEWNAQEYLQDKIIKIIPNPNERSMIITKNLIKKTLEIENGNDKNTIFVIENMECYFNDLKKFKDVIKGKNYILSFQSISSLRSLEIDNIFDEVYMFPTLDNHETKRDFITELKAKRKSFYPVQPRNVKFK